MDKCRKILYNRTNKERDIACANMNTQASAAHSHEFYHLNHVIEGELTVEFEKKQYKLEAGCTFVLPPDKPHSIRSKNGYLQFGVDILRSDDERGLVRTLDGALREYFADCLAAITHRADLPLDKLHSLMHTPTNNNLLRIAHFADGLLLDALDALKSELNDRFNVEFSKMIAKQNPWELQLCDMCRRLGISRTSLERRSAQSFGCGASEYCARLRYARICELLQTDLTLEAIAHETGFCDASHLSKFFCARAGISPGKYRRELH